MVPAMRSAHRELPAVGVQRKGHVEWTYEGREKSGGDPGKAAE